MEQITFLCNTSAEITNHLDAIASSIEGSEEIIFCVAYWKIESIRIVKDPIVSVLLTGKRISVFVSLNECITTPEALFELHQISEMYPSFTVYICKKHLSIFHSKIYYFRNHDRFTAIVGSANFTEGGFVHNDEASVKVEGSVGCNFHKDLEKYLVDLTKDKMVLHNQTDAISKYNVEFKLKYPNCKKHVLLSHKQLEELCGRFNI